jgi:hypothetical protein
MLDIWDVETSGGNVGGDQNTILGRLESVQVLQSLLLLKLGM